MYPPIPGEKKSSYIDLPTTLRWLQKNALRPLAINWMFILGCFFVHPKKKRSNFTFAFFQNICQCYLKRFSHNLTMTGLNLCLLKGVFGSFLYKVRDIFTFYRQEITSRIKITFCIYSLKSSIFLSKLFSNCCKLFTLKW